MPRDAAQAGGAARVLDDAVSVLKRASRPLGPMGAEWLQAQERRLQPPRAGDNR
jgi:hypothetical protein